MSKVEALTAEGIYKTRGYTNEETRDIMGYRERFLSEHFQEVVNKFPEDASWALFFKNEAAEAEGSSNEPSVILSRSGSDTKSLPDENTVRSLSYQGVPVFVTQEDIVALDHLIAEAV